MSIQESGQYRSGTAISVANLIGQSLVGAVRFIANPLRIRARQIENRRAFQSLLGKEDWVYEDMGICEADVRYLARQPLNVDAGKELERMRQRRTPKADS